MAQSSVNPSEAAIAGSTDGSVLGDSFLRDTPSVASGNGWLHKGWFRNLVKMGKKQTKVPFSLFVDEVHFGKIPPGINEVQVLWQKGSNIDRSSKVPVVENMAKFNQMLKLECTMYEAPASYKRKYMPKECVLKVVNAAKASHVLGYVKLDLSKLVGKVDVSSDVRASVAKADNSQPYISASSLKLKGVGGATPSLQAKFGYWNDKYSKRPTLEAVEETAEQRDKSADEALAAKNAPAADAVTTSGSAAAQPAEAAARSIARAASGGAGDLRPLESEFSLSGMVASVADASEDAASLAAEAVTEVSSVVEPTLLEGRDASADLSDMIARADRALGGDDEPVPWTMSPGSGREESFLFTAMGSGDGAGAGASVSLDASHAHTANDLSASLFSDVHLLKLPWGDSDEALKESLSHHSKRRRVRANAAGIFEDDVGAYSDGDVDDSATAERARHRKGLAATARATRDEADVGQVGPTSPDLQRLKDRGADSAAEIAASAATAASSALEAAAAEAAAAAPRKPTGADLEALESAELEEALRSGKLSAAAQLALEGSDGEEGGAPRGPPMFLLSRGLSGKELAVPEGGLALTGGGLDMQGLASHMFNQGQPGWEAVAQGEEMMVPGGQQMLAGQLASVDALDSHAALANLDEYKGVASNDLVLQVSAPCMVDVVVENGQPVGVLEVMQRLAAGDLGAQHLLEGVFRKDGAPALTNGADGMLAIEGGGADGAAGAIVRHQPGGAPFAERVMIAAPSGNANGALEIVPAHGVPRRSSFRAQPIVGVSVASAPTYTMEDLGAVIMETVKAMAVEGLLIQAGAGGQLLVGGGRAAGLLEDGSAEGEGGAGGLQRLSIEGVQSRGAITLPDGSVARLALPAGAGSQSEHSMELMDVRSSSGKVPSWVLDGGISGMTGAALLRSAFGSSEAPAPGAPLMLGGPGAPGGGALVPRGHSAAGLQLLPVGPVQTNLGGRHDVAMGIALGVEAWAHAEAHRAGTFDGASALTIVEGVRERGMAVIGSGAPTSSRGGKEVTLAMLVQLRDPKKGNVKVGLPMLAMVTAEKVTVRKRDGALLLEGGSAGANGDTASTSDGTTQRRRFLLTAGETGTAAGPSDSGFAQGEDGKEGGEAEGAAPTVEEEGDEEEETEERYRITGVHLCGLDTGRNRRGVDTRAGTYILGGGKKGQSHPMMHKRAGRGSAWGGGNQARVKQKTTVQKGDTLWSISAKVYGDGTKWKEVYKKNPHIRNPDIILPNERINLR
eukprot:jgi/Mesvir1/12180/Mv00422-RA.1